MTASPSPIALFGPGILMVKRVDIANQTPINIGKAQEFSLSLKGTTKELYGQNQLPDLVARSTIKATGKIKAARLSALACNAVFWGQNFTSGGFDWNIGEAFSVPGSSTYTYQTTNHATFEQDLGVVYAATGQPLVIVPSLTAAGQYTVDPATGIYTFDAADAGAALLVTYTSTLTTGQRMTYKSQPIGTTPVFQIDYWNNVNQPTRTPFAMRVFNCVGDSFDLGFKLEDFAMPEFDFGCFARADGALYDAIFPNVS